MNSIENRLIYDKKNELAWSSEINKHQMLYPNERIVAFLAKNYKDIDGNSNKKALDIGFGSGRHMKLLLDYGFKVYGIDYSQDSVNIAKEILGYHDNLKDLKKADLRDKVFESYFFDVVICYGIIFLRTVEEILIDLKIINSMMINEGRMIINFRTKEDCLYAKGEKINSNTYILDNSSEGYEDMCYTFLSCEEAEKLLNKAGFVIENRERYDLWKDNLSKQHTWWILSVRKE